MTDPARTWRKVSRGLIWITFGTFLLLTTLDVLPGLFWWRLLPFWPVLLVMLGLRVIFARSRAPALVLLSPALLIGTMTFVAVAQPTRPRGAAHAVEVSRTPSARAWRLESELALVDLDLRARSLPPDVLLQGEAFGGRDRPSLRVRGSEEVPRVRLRNVRGHRVIPFQGWCDEIRADLASDLPLVLEIEGAMTSGRIDLADLPVERVRLDGAFYDLVLVLGEPAEDTIIRLHGAFNRLELVVPATTPVRSVRDGLINIVEGRRRGSRLGGPAYRLDVEGFMNWVEVRSP